MTTPMLNPDTGKTADVHPAEVDNMKRAGWRVRDVAPPLPPPPPVSAPPKRETLRLKS